MFHAKQGSHDCSTLHFSLHQAIYEIVIPTPYVLMSYIMHPGEILEKHSLKNKSQIHLNKYKSFVSNYLL